MPSAEVELGADVAERVLVRAPLEEVVVHPSGPAPVLAPGTRGSRQGRRGPRRALDAEEERRVLFAARDTRGRRARVRTPPPGQGANRLGCPVVGPRSRMGREERRERREAEHEHDREDEATTPVHGAGACRRRTWSRSSTSPRSAIMYRKQRDDEPLHDRRGKELGQRRRSRRRSGTRRATPPVVAGNASASWAEVVRYVAMSATAAVAKTRRSSRPGRACRPGRPRTRPQPTRSPWRQRSRRASRSRRARGRVPGTRATIVARTEVTTGPKRTAPAPSRWVGGRAGHGRELERGEDEDECPRDREQGQDSTVLADEQADPDHAVCDDGKGERRTRARPRTGEEPFHDMHAVTVRYATELSLNPVIL